MYFVDRAAARTITKKHALIQVNENLMTACASKCAAKLSLRRRTKE